MLNNINSGDGLFSNSQLSQNSELQSAEKVSANAKTNPYAKKNLLVDESNISQEAMSLYEKEREIEKYKKMLLDQITEADANKEVASLIEQGVIKISEEDLAESMMIDEDLIKDLF